MEIFVFEFLDQPEVHAIGANKFILCDGFIVVQSNVVMVFSNSYGSGLTLQHHVTSFAVAWIILYVVLHVEESQLAVWGRHQNSRKLKVDS